MRACRRFTQPKRNRRWLPVCIFDADFSLLYTQHTPRRITQLKNVALQTLNSKVFIHRADHETTWLEYHCVVGRVGNGPAGGDRRQTRPSSPTQSPVDCIAMKIRRAPATLCRKTLCQHTYDRVKLFSFQIAIRVSTPDHFEKRFFGPFFSGNSSHDLLGQDIKRFLRKFEMV